MTLKEKAEKFFSSIHVTDQKTKAVDTEGLMSPWKDAVATNPGGSKVDSDEIQEEVRKHRSTGEPTQKH